MTFNLHNKWLKKNIENILIPALVDMGFEWKKQGAIKDVGREIVLGWPFGSMRRKRDHLVDIVEIQLDKYDRSKFRLNIGTCPVKGTKDHLFGKHYSSEEVSVHFLHQYWTMNSCPKFRTFFAIRFKAFRIVSEQSYTFLVTRVTGYLPEIERALLFGETGQHMSLIRYSV